MAGSQFTVDNYCSCTGTRRQFIWEMGAGFGGLALTSLLDQDGFFARQGLASEISSGERVDPLAPKRPHFAPRAKSCIFLFLNGGPSSVDTWDYKSELQRRDGEEVDTEVRLGSTKKLKILGSRSTFRQCGQSGLWCSEMFPHIAQQMDDLCVVKSLYVDTFSHGPAIVQVNTGAIIQGSPSVGSWLNYGLGNENENLPGFVVMLDPRGGPISGVANWSSGFMPAVYQGTHLRNQGEPILDLAPKNGVTRQMQRDLVDMLGTLNTRHMADRVGHSDLPARIATYELAFQLQMTAPDVMDLAQEDRRTLEMYGIFDPKPDHKQSVGPEPFGRQCLIARRLVERGVRFVQIYSGGGHQQNSWDAHPNMEENMRIHAPEIDRPVAGLLADLKQRGLLDETLVVCGGEFGRQPTGQGGVGRDHNPKGFLYWLAGGGVKAGTSYGETDELGYEAVVNRRHIRDLHATMLSLMGLDHNKLSYFYGGVERKLTGVQPARIIGEIVA